MSAGGMSHTLFINAIRIEVDLLTLNSINANNANYALETISILFLARLHPSEHFTQRYTELQKLKHIIISLVISHNPSLLVTSFSLIVMCSQTVLDLLHSHITY